MDGHDTLDAELVSATAEAMVREASSLAAQGRVLEAIEAYARLLGRFPRLPNAWYNLALLQRKTRRFSEALDSYRQALEEGIARPEEVYLNRGVIFAEHLRQDAAAEAELMAALQLNPVYVPALLNLANLMEDRGSRERAREYYQRALTLDSDNRLALARYANVANITGRADPLIDRLRAALAESQAGTLERADLGFSLGRALDSCGDYDSAFAAYECANADSRASSPAVFAYDRQAFERTVDRLMTAFPVAKRGEPTSPGPRPIFICGMFRSGSTLLEQLLAGHPRVTAGGELDLLPNAALRDLSPFPESMADATPTALQAIAVKYVDGMLRLFPAGEFVTDKRPDNFLYIGLIKRLFPDAKIVHTTRDALDNCLSIFFLHLDPTLGYATNLLDTGHYCCQYQRLMNHWKTFFGEDIVEVNYDALVRDPRPNVEKALQAFGLDWDDRCLTVPPLGRSIKTASVWQVREPIHQRSSGRSQHYASQLSELQRYLSEV